VSVPSAGRRWSVVVLMIGASVVTPSSAGTAWAAPSSASATITDAAAPTHATRGIVQAIDAHTMVITRAGDRGRMTFSLTPSTRREDAVVVGATVSVRFREEGQKHIATAIARHQLTEPR
jgi:hypothetical protein